MKSLLSAIYNHPFLAAIIAIFVYVAVYDYYFNTDLSCADITSMSPLEFVECVRGEAIGNDFITGEVTD